jgi:TPR repeat protein
MPILLKAAAGLFAGAVVGVLTVACWPRLEPAVVSSKPAVEQPKFVTAATVKAPEPSTAAAIAAPGADKTAIEKLAVALRGAPAPPDGAAGATRSLVATPIAAGDANSPDKALRLRAQGLVALAGGDVAGARAFLERAAEAGDARALLVLGDTYDPVTLTRMGAIGLKGDPARARDYYARALSAGVAAARDRIASREAQQN